MTRVVEPEPFRLNLRVVLGLLRGYWYFLVIGMLLGGAAATYYTSRQPEVYAADAVGLVTAGGSASAGEASVGDQVAKSRADAFEVLGSSRAVATRAASILGLDVPPAALLGQVSVLRQPGSPLIRITATGSDPRACRDLANAWEKALGDEISRIEQINVPVKKQADRGFLYLVPIDEASIPTAPFSPDPRRNLQYGLLGGLLLGAALALMRYRLDRRIHGVSDLTPFPVMVAGVIPQDSFLERRRGSLSKVIETDGHAGAAGEALRKLRTNLQFMNVDNPPRTIVITSPLPGDGKSTVAANLAVALAVAQQPVVLIDADLRRPTQAESFGLAEGAGLTDVLVGRAEFADVAQRPSNHPGLIILAAGPLPPNPSELLGSKAMGRVLGELAEVYTVIVDAPPLLPVTDAAVLTANADGALVVLGARKTLDVQLGDALDQLEGVNAKVLGLVLNRVKRGGRSGYYSYSYGAKQRRWLGFPIPRRR